MGKFGLEFIGRRLARYLSRPRARGVHVATSKPELLASTLKKGDVLLVEGTSRISEAIKYLTQSTWSHATLFVGESMGAPSDGGEKCVLMEADLNEGVRLVPLSLYSSLHTRICRPVGLPPHEIDRVVAYVNERIGLKYDVKNIVDLARYLIPTPPVPRWFRRRMIALGSGDPTRAICSSLIAQAFQSVRYPILPEVILEKSEDPSCVECYDEYLQIRHHSLFTPRDFDVSPFFEVIKPARGRGFDPHQLIWDHERQKGDG